MLVLVKISSTQHKKSVSKFNIYNLKKGPSALSFDKSKEIEQAHSLNPIQNGRPFPLEGNSFESEWHVQYDAKDVHVSVPLNPKSQIIVRFKWKDLIYYFLYLCFGLKPAPRYLHFLNTPISLMREMIVWLIIFAEQYFTVDIDMGQSHLPSSEFRFFDQYKKILASFMRDHTVFRHGNKFNRHEYNSSTGEKGRDSKAVSRSSKDVSILIQGLTQFVGRLASAATGAMPAPT